MTVRRAELAGVFDSPAAAVAAVVERLLPVSDETVALHRAAGRILAEPVRTDRPSPACDVSAMDGYAVRLDDVKVGHLPVAGEVSVGRSPPRMPRGAALRIFTGGPVPDDCEAIIPREQVRERPEAIDLPANLCVAPGRHIRRRGENGQAGETIVEAGTRITPAVVAAMAASGIREPAVHRQVRVTLLVTGNEVHDVGVPVRPWQLRDSNGPALTTMFAGLAWVVWNGVRLVPDDRGQLRKSIVMALAESDAVLLTGGVSMGDYDFVPSVLTEVGCRIVFHGLPIRPGKPVLGAIGSEGQAVLGLPGNPVPVMTTARRIAVPVLRHVAGYARHEPPTTCAALANADNRTLDVYWSRPVRLVGHGQVGLVPTCGAGDIISAARSDGFVEIPPNQGGSGPWPFYRWSADDA